MHRKHCGEDDVQSSQSKIPSRPIKRGVWSSSLEEEEMWKNALVSLTGHRGKGRCHRNNRCVDGSFIDCTEIPKIIHFIWLGSNPIPKFPLVSNVDGYNETTFPDCPMNNLEWNDCMLSWKKHHPQSDGWRIHVWTEKDIVNDDMSVDTTYTSEFRFILSQMCNAEAFKHAMKIRHYALASDLLRLEILNKFGGVYVDIDYLCLQSLDSIADSSEAADTEQSPSLQFFCGESNTGCFELNNGLIGCRRHGHPIIWDMIRSVSIYCKNLLAAVENPTTLPEIDPVKSLLSSFLDSETLDAMNGSHVKGVTSLPSPMDVIEHTGPGLITRTVFRWLCNHGVQCDDSVKNKTFQCGKQNDNDSQASFETCQVMVFPRDVFHPLPNHLRKDTFQLHDFIIQEVTIAVHLWGCSWQSNV